MLLKKIALLSALFLTLGIQESFSYGVGTSLYPMRPTNHQIGIELAGLVGSGKGIGTQARYNYQYTKEISIHGGAGFGSGKRSNRFFAGSEIEIYPDYMNQPSVSIRAQLENAYEYGNRHNRLSMGPTVSKGFSFWGHEAYPYAHLPLTLALNSDNKSYQVQIHSTLGIAGKIPHPDYDQYIAFFESTISLRDSYSAIMTGVSYPFD